MRTQFTKRSFPLSFVAALLATVTMIGCAGGSPITVSIDNNSGQKIQSIVATYTGGSASFGSFSENESQEVEIRPTGESHIELEIQPVEGAVEHRVVDTYFERGYRGKIRITLNSGFTVQVSPALTP